MRSPERYLETLRRIPDDIILAIAAQDFDEYHGHKCVCGWALRENVARELNIAPESRAALAGADSTFMPCAERFGGVFSEWLELYEGAAFDTPNVEAAFVDRLNEIVKVPAKRRLRGSSSSRGVTRD